MNYLTLLDDLFAYADKNGIKKVDIGREIYGENCRTNIYMAKNVTIETLQKIKNAIEKIKKSRKSITKKLPNEKK